MRQRISKMLGSATLGMALGICVSATTASANLVAYYPLNGNLNDASGNGNTGTAGPDLSFGGAGSGLSGNAGDQGIVSSGGDGNQYFTSPVNINNLDQVTFGGWFKTTAADPIRGLISNDTGGFGRGIDIDNRGLSGYAAFGGGPFGGAPVTGGWDFVAVTYNRTAQTQTLDVNGTFYTATGTAPPNGETVLTIGKNPNFDNPYGGTIDNVFIYDTALSESALNSIQVNGVPEPAACGLLAAAGVGALIRRRRA